MKDSWFKFTSTALLSVVLTLGAAWFSLNASAVTKAQVQDMIQPDRETLQHTYEEVRELRKQITELTKEVGELKGLVDRKR